MKFVLIFCAIAFMFSADSLAVNTRSSKAHHECRGNSTYGSYSLCRVRCDDYDNPPHACPASIIQGCMCNEGYIPVDKNTNPLRCVKPEDCPK
ncbi:hypothetical protein TNIN_139221 [Trichonephila inaurata madagascariensis]|uniref:TIL domain-containing protein n=1 Tax=Trichonephila inaurata madagascariensis TaxID=2747483 RepID=A0A8X6X300_9ARAC|nr:hypothetical protein TNIN_139221 [Trichonephila inaurata madagascariensis]